VIKCLGVLKKEVQPEGRPQRRHYLAGLSLGPSSAAMVSICEEIIAKKLAGRRDEPFDLHVVHVATDVGDSDNTTAEKLLQKWRDAYPRFAFESIPISSALDLRSIDWSCLPALPPDGTPDAKLQGLLAVLPSKTSRADVLRLLIRHLLLAQTTRRGCDGLLLGSSTTALAELTLAEAAKGRGFSLPWRVHDGRARVAAAEPGVPAGDAGVPVCYAVRDLFRKELVAYGAYAAPPLAELTAPDGGAGAGKVVVSHKDLSIEEVMVRYFAEVEENYPSIVANVARTAAKLDRPEGDERCGLCGMVLDEQGDDRWRGEIGEERASQGAESGQGGKLCYGCMRSVGG
jgi:cytoplasmic tRNA 2-thiolation protein 2